MTNRNKNHITNNKFVLSSLKRILIVFIFGGKHLTIKKEVVWKCLEYFMFVKFFLANLLFYKNIVYWNEHISGTCNFFKTLITRFWHVTQKRFSSPDLDRTLWLRRFKKLPKLLNTLSDVSIIMKNNKIFYLFCYTCII